MKLIYTTLLIGISFLGFAQMTGWNAIKPITITENSGSTIYGYQLALDINTATEVANNGMSINGSDIRFTSGCYGGVNFPYWIESGMNTSSTRIWVKIDSLIGNSSRTIYMHYGNVSASSISSFQTTLDGPHSSTDSVSGGNAGGVTDSQRGFRFIANEDIYVTAFGKNEPNGSTRYITLFDGNTQAIINQTQVSGPGGQYTYQNLTSPFWLQQGGTYLLQCYQGSSDGYYFGASPQIGQHLTYLDMRYCNGCNQNTFPTNYLNSIHYGYPDFLYYTRKQISPPPTYTFSGVSINTINNLSICQNDTAQILLEVIGGTAPFSSAWTGNGLIYVTDLTALVSPPDTVTFQVWLSDYCGFNSNTTIIVNVKSLPTVSIQPNFSTFCAGQTGILNANGADSYLWNTGVISDSIFASPTVNSVYTVIGTLDGCEDSTSFNWNVNLPQSLSQSITLCFGSSYSIGSNTYFNDGVYIDTLLTVSNCDSIVTTTLSFANAIDAQIQLVNPTTLIADSGADGYQWVNCSNGYTPIPGANSTSFIATENGSFACVITVGNCTETSDCVIVSEVGIGEISDKQFFTIAPNPNHGIFTIESTQGDEFVIFDLLGKQIQSFSLIANEKHTIDMSSCMSGVYFVFSKSEIKKIIIE